MRLQLFILLLASMLMTNSYAQSHILGWAAQIGGSGIERYPKFTTDPLGNLITIGEFSSTVDFDPGVGVLNLQARGTQDLFIQKLDPAGNLLWAARVGDSSQFIRGFGVSTDQYGNIFVTGTFNGTIDFDPGTGVNNATNIYTGVDAFILKLDVNGNFKMLVQNPGEGSIGNFTHISSNGNIYNLGTYNRRVGFITPVGTVNMTTAGRGTYIQKLDSTGAYIWAKGYITDYLWDAIFDDQDNMYLCGNFDRTVDFDPGTGVYTMTTLSNALDVYLIKLDSNANLQWAKEINDDPVSPNAIAFRSLSFGLNGDLVLSGIFEGTIDFDPDSAASLNITSGRWDDAFFQKYDNNGNMLWTKVIGDDGYDRGFDIEVDPAGKHYLAFVINDMVDVDPGAGIHYLTTKYYYSRDLVIEQLDPSGNFVWAMQIASVPSASRFFMEIDNVNELYITGEIRDTVDVDPSSINNPMISRGITDIMITKFITGVTSINQQDAIQNKPTLYPNPSRGSIFIDFHEQSWEEVSLYDMNGKMLFNELITSAEKHQLDLQDFPSGTYFIRLESNGKTYVEKVVVR